MNIPREPSAKDNEILRLVATSFVTVKEIADRLFMSESTVRRRLAGLEKAGWIIRTHGGAMLNKNQPHHKNLPLYLRSMQLDGAKQQIAQKAVSLIADGDTIFIDSSSTALFLLPLLSRFQQLAVFTNSLKAASVLSEMEIPCTVFGGDVIPSEMACLSEETYAAIANTHADILFFSCDALSADGVLSDNSKRGCYLRRQYMQHARRTVLLIDDTKLGKQHPYRLCDLSDVDVCVCNQPLPPAVVESAPNTTFYEAKTASLG